MPFSDIFKKKQKKEKNLKPIEKPKAVEELKEVKPLEVKEKKFSGSYQILKSPHITEKATDLTKKNHYIFKIYSQANKTEVKKAIENLYGVDVLSVKIINVPAKKRRLGRVSGWRKGYKKAIVRIREGQKIEVLPR